MSFCVMCGENIRPGEDSSHPNLCESCVEETGCSSDCHELFDFDDEDLDEEDRELEFPLDNADDEDDDDCEL